MQNVSQITSTVVYGECHHSPQTAPGSGGSFADSLQESMDAAGNTGNTGSTGTTGNVEHHTMPSHDTTQSSKPESGNVSQGTSQGTSQVEHHTSYGANAEQTTQAQTKTVQKRAAEVTIDGVKYPSGMFIIQFETAETDAAKPEKELADLLAKTEDVLGASERMLETLKGLIQQAFEELNSPGVDEEEFAEMVLDFLMKYIDEKFGDKLDSSSAASDDEDEDIDIHDALLQAVAQILEEIRSSENAEAPSETETVEEVDEVPPSDMPAENADTTVSELLGDEVEETDSVIETVIDTEKTERNDVPQTTTAESTERTEEEDTNTVAMRTVEQIVNTVTVYQAAAQAAEAIYTAVIQPQKTESEPIQPVKSERTVSVIQPADELEELTRLVKGGDTVKPERPETQLLFDQNEKQETEETVPEVKLDAIGETVPFEAAIARSAPQVTLTNSFSNVGSGAQQVVSQIASEIFNNLSEAGNGTTTFVMTLNPESLGKVTVKMVEEAGKLSVTVTAHSKHTAELLSDRYENLQAAMKDSGTQLEKYQVVYAPEHDEGSQHNFDGSSKNPYVRQDSEEGEGGTEFAELLQEIV